MKTNSLKIAFFGSSLVSAYWNGAATYYRGLIKELHKIGHEITFFEPDAYDRQNHRDLENLSWAKVVVYQPREEEVLQAFKDAEQFDILIKASGVGIFDELLEKSILTYKRDHQLSIFWDVDAPATLKRLETFPLDPFRPLIPHYDLIFTYGGGSKVVKAYEGLGAKKCVPIYNALDPETHFPVTPDLNFQCHLGLLANRLPDRESRVEEFFFRPARMLKNKKFILGGNGWADKILNEGENIHYHGHVYTRDHNSFNCSSMTVLNVNRDCMADIGFSPATRIFEAAGAGACIISDAWEGIEPFLNPGEEILLVENGQEVVKLLEKINPEQAKEIGEKARKRILSEHTYAHRAHQVNSLLQEASQNLNNNNQGLSFSTARVTNIPANIAKEEKHLCL